MSAVEKCMRCRRRYRGGVTWNVVLVNGRQQGILCPDCQTPDENAEAERNLADGTTAGLSWAHEARLIDHAELTRVNDIAVRDDEVALTDEAIEEFQGVEHLVVSVGTYAERMLTVVYLGYQHGACASMAVLSIAITDWMDWEDRREIVSAEVGEHARAAAIAWSANQGINLKGRA